MKVPTWTVGYGVCKSVILYIFIGKCATRPHCWACSFPKFRVCWNSILTLSLCTDQNKVSCCSFQAVDYESRSSYSFSVEVLNPIVDPRFLRRGPFKDRASIRVAVLDADEPPRFSRSRYLMDVSENCPPACTVGRISAVDPDTGLTNNIRYTTGSFCSIQHLESVYTTLVKMFNE